MHGSKTIRIASIGIGLVIAVVGIFLALHYFGGGFSRASDQTPRDVVVDELTTNSAKISWSTGVESQGVIEYGTSPTALNFFAPESAQTKSHQVELTLLAQSTAYYFDIRVGDQKYDNGGVPWTFSTKATGVSPTPEITIIPSANPSPKPISTIVIPNPTATGTTSACTETSCVSICQKLGKGCNSSDLVKNNCIGKIAIQSCTEVTPTPTP